MDDIYIKIKSLVQYLNDCTRAYDEGNPLITDKEYDDKYFELQELEKESGLILSNSPTQTISYEVVNELNKITHSHKMLSLEKTKSISDVRNFVGNKTYLAMCKMDGLTCTLTYRNGELVSAGTRGNGFVGEDILHNARVLSSIPSKIPYTDELVIDGEIICTYNDFKEFSSEYKNPRNFAAGSIRLLDSKECAGRNLSFVAWDIITSIYSKEEIELRLSQKLDYLASIGFTVVPFQLHNGISETDDLIKTHIEEMQTIAKECSYPIDGVVIKFDDCAYGRSLGETTHHFKNALAYKFYDETYPTTLINIEYTIGRLGTLTPVAVFEPIDIDGSTVERASLHNISVMEDLSGGFERKGDILYVYKSNQIIPQVDSWEHVGEYDEALHIPIPEECPICGNPTKICTSISGTRELICLNPNCTGKLVNRLEHFCGKKGLDIKGISKATLEKLIEWNWVNEFSDIFKLEQFRNEWIKKPGFGVKSVDKILESINAGRTCDLNQFICALGIPLIGDTASKALSKAFNYSWTDFVNAINQNFAFDTLPNFGYEMQNAIISFDYTEAILIAENYIIFNKPQLNKNSSELKDKVFVITGKLFTFKNRDAIKSCIESLGGKVTGSVSKNTHYLINNDINSNSSKNITAKSLNIPILSEEEFIQTFGISI